MNSADDPEEYIRKLERGVGKTPEAGPEPSATPPSSPAFAEGTSPRRFAVASALANAPRKWLVAICAVPFVLALAFFAAHYAGKTTVHGDLVMINSGAKDTVDCNNGNVKLDGDNNTYTITGHCRRLDVFGSANHVTVDSADTIGVFGDDNAVAYHSGSPTINKTGNNNIVAQRISTR
jgi:Protein of unknown function (DUF3060)